MKFSEEKLIFSFKMRKSNYMNRNGFEIAIDDFELISYNNYSLPGKVYFFDDLDGVKKAIIALMDERYLD